MVIKLSNLAKRFHQQWIFRDLNFELKNENSYAITGPNGSGKTTLLQVIAGMQPVTKGTIQYRSTEGLVEADDFYKFLSFVAPYLEMIEEFSLREFLNFHFSFKPITKSYTIDQIIEDSGLADSREKRLKTFSSGMRQRVKLALSFYSEAPVIFLDEPTANLDHHGINWYLERMDGLKTTRLVLIGSNQPYEYEFCQESIDLTDYK
ncbi:MAG: ABC transporter ATP-binding protein [Cyclobacteriaceae bacterium]